MARRGTQVLGARSVDARGRDHTPDRAPRLCGSRHHRQSLGDQRRVGPVPGGARPSNPRGVEVAARPIRIRPPRRCVGDRGRRRSRPGRRCEIVAWSGGGRGCAPHSGRRPTRSIHAHRRIGADRSWAGRADVCGCVGPARRGGRGGDGDRSAHQVWPHRGACSHGSRRQLPAAGSPARRAESRRIQRRRHRAAAGLCLRATTAICRDYSSGSDGGPRLHTGRVAGHVYLGVGDRRTVAGAGGRSSNPALRSG